MMADCVDVITRETSTIDGNRQERSVERTTRWHWAILLAIIVVAVLLRMRLLEVPLERDEGEYAYIAQLMLQGIPP